MRRLVGLLREDDVSLDDLAFARNAAMRRARSGFALEDYINAFRVGQQVFWEAVVDAAGPTPAGRELIHDARDAVTERLANALAKEFTAEDVALIRRAAPMIERLAHLI